MQKIPIQLQWSPLAVGAKPADLNQLGQLIAAQLAASIQGNVSFFIQGNVDPSTYVGDLFYNVAQNLFKGWNAGSGRYLPITQFIPGDTKTSFVTGDSPTTGWVVCNGRLISDVPNLSQYQVAILQNLFGATGSLPNIAPLQSLLALPTDGSFGNITNPAVAPPAGQIGALTFSSPPAQTEVQALGSNTETLDASVIALQTAVAAVISNSEAVLNSLNAGSGTGLTTSLFCGYP